MMRKQRWMKWLVLLVVCGAAFFAVSSVIGGDGEVPLENHGEVSLADVGRMDLLNRAEVLETIEQTRMAFEQNPDAIEIRFRLAESLYQAGYFPEARDLLLPLCDMPEPTAEVLFLMAELDYLLANYESAEQILNHIINVVPDDFLIQLKVRSKLMYVYYQTNQYTKAADLFPGQAYQPSLALKSMQAFQGEVPYQVTWHNEEHKTAIPFIVTKPLPVLPIEVEGKRIYVLLDTGGATLVLDHGVVDKLGIHPIDAGVSSFTRDTNGVVTMGKADSVKIGDVTLENVPLITLPVKEFTFGLLGGVLGTNVLQQFLPTIDYPNGQLILREKSELGRELFQAEIAGQEAVEVPFYLADTHFMMAKGTLNGKDDLMFFVDSGLAAEEAFETFNQTLEFAGISIPEPSACDGLCISADGGGLTIGSDDAVTTGPFSIERLGLGSLIQEGHIGINDMVTSDYQELGFIVDGLISHQYLKQYAWTIDFTEMKMVFVPSP